MQRIYPSLALGVFAALLLTTTPVFGQNEQSQAVADGGISIDGWMGQVDAKEAGNGQVLSNAKLTMDGEAMHATTGPSLVYWHPDNTAKGDYTVNATFSEPEYMNLGGHAHPYGVFIGGNDLGTDKATLLYCAAYGNGSFIVRGFGPAPFQMNGSRPSAHDAVHKAADKLKPVTQDIAISVTADKVECAINGTVVASYAKADVVGEGKLKSTDGLYGIRSGHNTEVLVSGLALAKK
jgi:hypothetical protein